MPSLLREFFYTNLVDGTSERSVSSAIKRG